MGPVSWASLFSLQNTVLIKTSIAMFSLRGGQFRLDFVHQGIVAIWRLQEIKLHGQLSTASTRFGGNVMHSVLSYKNKRVALGLKFRTLPGIQVDYRPKP